MIDSRGHNQRPLIGVASRWDGCRCVKVVLVLANLGGELDAGDDTTSMVKALELEHRS